MRTKAIVTAVWCLTASLSLLGQEGGRKPEPVSTADVDAPAIAGVFAAGTKAKVVYQWEAGLGAEGPVSLPDGSAIFTQTSGKKIIKVDNNNVGSVFVDVAPAQVFGLAYDPKHGVVATYRGSPNGVVALPSRKALADNFDGKKFDRPNDVVANGKGGIYFSDNSGIRGKEGPAPGSAPPGVYHITPDGKVLLAWEGKPDCPPSCTALQRPNGVQLSPDLKVFYVATGGAARWVYAFDIQPDGRLRNPREFADLGETGGADGMVIDASGRLYVAAATRLMVFDQTGKPLGAVTFPQRIANLTFAGPDRKTLFIVGGQVAYKLPVLTEGVKGRQK